MRKFNETVAKCKGQITQRMTYIPIGSKRTLQLNLNNQMIVNQHSFLRNHKIINLNMSNHQKAVMNMKNKIKHFQMDLERHTVRHFWNG